MMLEILSYYQLEKNRSCKKKKKKNDKQQFSTSLYYRIWKDGGVLRLTGAGASQQIIGKSSVRDDYQLKALKALMIGKRVLMRICEGGFTSVEVKCSVKIQAARPKP